MSSYPRAHLSPAKAQDPHSISLKVLRLSRPTLATQTTLPATAFGNGLDIPPQASRAYPSSDETSPQLGAEFPLTPLLTLPAAFGAAYIGEAFTCTLCANNELDANGARTVSGVRIVAELQTPSIPAGTALELKDGAGVDPTSGDAGEDGRDVLPGETLQKTLRHELKEEGPHVLAVTVSYTETMQSGSGGASGGRARTFRKLYQFVAQQAIAVRSKVTERRCRVAEEGEVTGVGAGGTAGERGRLVGGHGEGVAEHKGWDSWLHGEVQRGAGGGCAEAAGR